MWKNNLPHRYKLENWEYTCEDFEMFKKKQPNLILMPSLKYYT